MIFFNINSCNIISKVFCEALSHEIEIYLRVMSHGVDAKGSIVLPIRCMKVEAIIALQRKNIRLLNQEGTLIK